VHVRAGGNSLDDGTPVSDTIVERLAPHSFIRALIHDIDGNPLTRRTGDATPPHARNVSSKNATESASTADDTTCCNTTTPHHTDTPATPSPTNSNSAAPPATTNNPEHRPGARHRLATQADPAKHAAPCQAPRSNSVHHCTAAGAQAARSVTLAIVCYPTPPDCGTAGQPAIVACCCG